MKNKLGKLLIFIGFVLVFLAILLKVNNLVEDKNAEEAAKTILSNVKTFIEEEKILDKKIETKEPEEEIFKDMPIMEIDGHEYIGYISIPHFDLELAVMADWSLEKLKISPCRHWGSTKTDNIVIAAHNYKKHFSILSSLKEGDEIIFTEMDGAINLYEVEKQAVVKANDLDAIKEEGALVLYTCNYNGTKRIAVFCKRAI